jgi:hypothetical protein
LKGIVTFVTVFEVSVLFHVSALFPFVVVATAAALLWTRICAEPGQPPAFNLKKKK